MKNVKSILFSLLAVAVIALSMTSCEQETLINDNPINLLTNQKVSEFNLDVETENGMLKFSGLQEFEDAIAYVSDSEDRFFTDEALATWEKNIGFTSLRQKTAVAMDEFEAITDDNSMNVFRSENNDFVNPQGEFQTPIADEALTSVLDEKGKVIIGTVLHCFTDKYQIIILDKDESKLEAALASLATNEEEGVYVFKYVQDDVEFRGDCGTLRSCQDDNGTSNGSKRVSGEWRANARQSPVFNWNCGCYTHWENSVSVSCEMISQKKGLFGWKKNKDDNIEWATGYGIKSSLGTITHGTGWTQKDWKITYYKTLLTSDTPFGLAPPGTYREFFYNNTTLINLDASGVSCEDDCF